MGAFLSIGEIGYEEISQMDIAVFISGAAPGPADRLQSGVGYIL